MAVARFEKPSAGGHPETWRPRARTPLVVALDGDGRGGDEVGGKGASLDLLVARRFPVPPAIAATTRAYREFIAGAPRLADFLARLDSTPVTAAADMEEEQAEVDARFAETPLPPTLVAALAAQVGPLLHGNARVAVRSSATAEDLATSSFAGQHLSVLDVRDLSGVLDAVRRVWASLWHPAPRAYRAHMGVPADALAMAVVIQQMVPAERSGVVFTSDPTRSHTLRLEVVDGLGELLVSGAATPDVVQVELPSLRSRGGEPLDRGLRAVVRTALLIEEEFGGTPQDVEWSLVGDDVFVLQARPITTDRSDVAGDGFDTETTAGHQYAQGGIAEMVPGVVPPLLWTINGPMLEEAFRRLFGRLGVLPDDLVGPFGIVGRIRGQAVLDLTRVKEASQRMGGGSGAEVERQYLGRFVTEPEDDGPSSAWRQVLNARASLRALRMRRDALAQAALAEEAVAEVLAGAPDFNQLRSTELTAYRARLRDLAAATITAEVAVAVAAVASYRALEVTLERWVGGQASHWAQRLTRDAASGGANPFEAAAARWTEVEHSSASKALADAIATASASDAEERLRAVGPAGVALTDAMWAELRRYGSAAVYAGPTWDEESEYVWESLLASLRTRIADGEPDRADGARRGAEAAMAELEAELTGSRRWRVTRILTGQVVDVRLRMLRQLTHHARVLLSRRESVKSALLAVGGLERRCTIALAGRLARRGALAEIDDAELLADWEFEALVAGRSPVTHRELRRRRQAMEAARASQQLPPLVDHTGHAIDIGGSGDGLSGWGASPGRHRGRVRIVSSLSAATKLQPGEVLVAPATDPSWTPLFLTAGAVVVERGGPLSHAAIVARELGLPAVLNAVGATQRLRTGQLVEVDGSRGVVRVLESRPDIDLVAAEGAASPSLVPVAATEDGR